MMIVESEADVIVPWWISTAMAQNLGGFEPVVAAFFAE
jgi:hypothetical protein